MQLITSLLLTLGGVVGVPVNNGVEGDVEIQCGPTFIQMAFGARNPFQGFRNDGELERINSYLHCHRVPLAEKNYFKGFLYAKNHFGSSECMQIGDSNSLGSSIRMDFDSCNVKRRRTLEPRGVFVSATVVVQFHPLVLTKVDRAYHLECFYMEADKTVDTALEVSMLTTEVRTLQVPMPVCHYEILEEGPNGPPLRFADIGDKVYHKWTCDTETVDTFCMVVYGCYVEDGAGDDFLELIDNGGCATDKNLLDNLDYSSDLMAGQQAHVFKYADRPQLYFNCQIRINAKQPGQECLRPVCPDPVSSLGRKRRASGFGSLGSLGAVGPRDGFLDVQRPLYVPDLSLSLDTETKRTRRQEQKGVDDRRSAHPQEGHCWSAGLSESVGALCSSTAVIAGVLASLHLLRYTRGNRVPRL